jgi:hypothetical protein
LSRSTARCDVPDIKPNPSPPFKGCGAHPLSDAHRALIVAAADRVKKHTGEDIDLNSIQTTDDAVRVFDRYEQPVKTSIARS